MSVCASVTPARVEIEKYTGNTTPYYSAVQGRYTQEETALYMQQSMLNVVFVPEINILE